MCAFMAMFTGIEILKAQKSEHVMHNITATISRLLSSKQVGGGGGQDEQVNVIDLELVPQT
jgi:hypothetical protein